MAQLRLFRAILLAGSISGGARTAGTSQPSASRMIRRMEDQVGYRLFVNVAGRIAPTEEGLLLFHEVEAVFDRLDRVQEVARRLQGGARPDPLVIGSPTSFAMRVLPGVVDRLRHDFPLLQVTFDARNFADQVRAIEHGDMHVGIGIAAEMPSQFQRAFLGDQRLFALMPRNHILASRPELSIECFGEHDCIMGLPSAPMTSIIDLVLRRHGVVPKAELRIGSLSLSEPLVRRFGMLAIVDGLTAQAIDLGEELVVLPLSDMPAVSIQACWKAGAPPSRVRDRLLELLRIELSPGHVNA